MGILDVKVNGQVDKENFAWYDPEHQDIPSHLEVVKSSDKSVEVKRNEAKEGDDRIIVGNVVLCRKIKSEPKASKKAKKGE